VTLEYRVEIYKTVSTEEAKKRECECWERREKENVSAGIEGRKRM
jgi:hypothetical protein